VALNAYLRLRGQKQGDIKGSVTQKGREGSILVYAFSHDLVVPRDPASGQASGKRMHKPVTITKDVDKSTPLLYQALIANENLPEWELQFWQTTTSTGGEQQYYTVSLANSSISSIGQRMANNKDPNVTRYEVYEEIAFTYQRITWTWKDGGLTSQDVWSAPA
jgi:type VI secretion system secreted protein Hcp